MAENNSIAMGQEFDIDGDKDEYEEFKEKFLLRFGKTNDSKVAIRSLRSLRQTGSVSNYASEFEALRIRTEVE
ncbi:hypothetical protein BGW41_005352 [Actinomortierella wolfii]|nr:hypothetical protein BGW41_005352 [Actinomortierella wolfii]